MAERPDDICARQERIPPQPTHPAAPPIFPASVHVCESTEQAAMLLAGETPGYVYQRDGHANADMFGEKCRELHGAECAAVASSGMAALSVALLSQTQRGDHVVLSSQLYGRSSLLLTSEIARLGIDSTEVNTCDLTATAAAFNARTKLVVVETISNPLLRVADIASLAKLARQYGAKLLVDNTFATPIFCRPLELGADFVLESVSKMINGHSDVMLGLLCGKRADWQRVPLVLSAWGLASSPFDCWLATRGVTTLHVRMERAAENAIRAAEFLRTQPQVVRVDYPGLSDHLDHQLAARQFRGGFGIVVTFHLRGDLTAANALIAATPIPFCPSLGEVATTLSHPASTSHRGMSIQQQRNLGITGGTIRLSAGIESSEYVLGALAVGLNAVG